MRKAYLTLENGRVFEGYRFGAEKDATGELVFNTGMVGYLETLTDPGYFGQLLVQTFPLIGNYGVIPEDFESDRPRLAAYIVREWCDTPSNFRAGGDLDGYLRAVGTPGLYGIDTRALTRILRTEGVMRATLSDAPGFVADTPRAVNPVMAVTCREITTILPGDVKRRVAVLDLGVKRSIIDALYARGCEIVTFPADTPAEEVLACRPDGIVLSNGPGDPAVNTAIIAEIEKLAQGGVPLLGICLGHLLLALSQGMKTYKMRFGHRGANQPVRDVRTGHIYSTSQNHGYAILPENLPDGITPRFVNANDGGCEGLAFAGFPALSAQFYPTPDTAFLYDEFLQMMEVSACR